MGIVVGIDGGRMVELVDLVLSYSAYDQVESLNVVDEHHVE